MSPFSRSERTSLLLLMSLVLAPLAAGCHDGGGVTAPGIPIVESPQSCLAALRQACSDRNLNEYLQVLTDDFVFVFSPGDTSNPACPTPAQWSLGDERIAVERMFASFYDVSVNFVLTDTAPLGGADAHHYRIQAETTVAPAIRTPDGGGLTLMLQNSVEVFYLKQVPTLGGGPVWRIYRWEEKPAENRPKAGIGSATGCLEDWGQLKYRCRYH